MSVKDQIEIFGAASPMSAGAKHVADIVAALTPPMGDIRVLGDGTSMPAPKRDRSATVATALGGLVPTAVGGGVGYTMWKKHKVLGFLAGSAAANIAWDNLRHGEYKKAAVSAAVTGAAVLGSLKMKKHPVLGFIGAMVVGTIVAANVDGTNEQDWWHKVKSR
jgi:hypothetical protein